MGVHAALVSVATPVGAGSRAQLAPTSETSGAAIRFDPGSLLQNRVANKRMRLVFI
ncbi:hypothetical protein ppKF707_0472 [Metapseudomonas furukawaii]|uniref:Uncharacterized protein n=1 Tax=Metapseudomonas furukawaii TaxID=1149133 RepID=A0AAD1BXJ8_METFU|nr:hypothetical protein ppKF707_0472 [Pseudomonas furukawaii]BAU72292.1 hypothetical protein KF707C_6040 [Pseudomonas furukawaii]